MMRAALILVLSLGCMDTTEVPTDAAPPRVLRCEVPRAITMVPSDEPPNQGVPVAAIGWTEGECALRAEVGHPDDLVVVADLTGFLAGSLSLVTVDGWRIVSSSLSSGPRTMLVGLPRDTDIEILLGRDDVRVELVMRVEGDEVIVVSMTLA